MNQKNVGIIINIICTTMKQCSQNLSGYICITGNTLKFQMSPKLFVVK